MSTSIGVRGGAFLAQPSRRKGAFAMALDLYATHNGFRFLSNFAFFGGLTLACLTLSSNLGGSSGTGAGLFSLAALAPAASAATPIETGPGLAAPKGGDLASPSAPSVANDKSAALIQALGPAADTNPAAPVLADYELGPIAVSSAKAQLAAGLAAIRQGGTANIESGMVLLKQAADAGSPTAEALYGLARLAPPAALPPDTVAGREWLQRAADAGDVQAARLLARAYLNGSAGFSDPDKAQTLYRHAHDLGDARASLALAGLMARGLGGGVDTAQAEQLIRVAAVRGDPQAMTALGQYLTSTAGKSGAPSYDEAVLWLTRAADQGDLSAMEQLGDIHMFLAKTAPTQDPAKGFSWYQKCAAAGRAACHYALGRAYSLALGTSGDLAEAWAQLSQARDAGQPRAAGELTTLETRLSPAQRVLGLTRLAQLKAPLGR